MTYIASTSAFNMALHHSIANLQTKLSRAHRELTTGRHADLGVAIGGEAGRAHALGSNLEDIGAIVETNKLVATRLETTLTALASLSSSAQNFRSALISARNNGGEPATLATQAKALLGNLTATLNTSDGDSFVFGGVNHNAAPMANYFAEPPSDNKRAFAAAFRQAFGFDQGSSAVSSITPDQMRAFVDGAAVQLFSPDEWRSDWSTAADAPLRSRISINQQIDTSVTANDPALRQLAMAYTMLSDLSITDLKDETFQVIVDAATQRLDRGVMGLTQMRTRVGVMQDNVDKASRTMSLQQGLLTNQIGSLENVDTEEVATRINNLMTQLETAYVLTSHIMQLSLSKHL